LGRAIVRHPKVFLMDEPLSNLDAKLRVHMRAEISKLHKRLGATIVYVTHDQTEAMTMGDRIVVMKDGYIQQVDTPLNLYNQPANMFVAGFIGSPAMNFLTVTLKQKAGEIRVIGEGWQVPAPSKWEEAADNSCLVLGVRPEDIRLQPLTENSVAAGIVEVIEPMGAESYVYVNLANKTIIARVEPNLQIKPGDQVAVNFVTEKLHLFNGQNEQTIFNGNQGA
ncbi:MAG: TOBE domain-containing protein, partial [Bacillota bacterium]|nr:TOBE domain-containing protein [Bacillota bacterium]